MLAEHHDISREFPEYQRKVEQLRVSNKDFDSIVARHDYLDDEIRRLEELQSPTSDQEMRN